jgi:hypothetical protein
MKTGSNKNEIFKTPVTNYSIRSGKELICLEHSGYAEHCSVNRTVSTKVATTLAENGHKQDNHAGTTV